MRTTVPLLALLTLCFLSAPRLAADGVFNTILTTTTTAEIDNNTDTPVSQQVAIFSTELIARMKGGPALLDQTLSVAFSDGAFQALISSAESLLMGDGATSFLGPTLLSNSTATGTASSTVQTGKQFVESITGTSIFFAPATVVIGDRGICDSFTLDANNHASVSGCTQDGSSIQLLRGSQDTDTSTLSFFNTQTTTTTITTVFTSQVYELDGVTSSTTVPEPASIGLLGLAMCAIFSKRSRLFRLR